MLVEKEDTSQAQSETTPPVVWIAAVEWDDLPGTDSRMVTELAKSGPVIWVDPSRRGVWRGWMSRRSPAVERVGVNLLRLRSPATPALTRWPVRLVTAALMRMTIIRGLAGGRAPRAVVIANPYTAFPRGVGGTRAMYVTDDWIAGASLMGARERSLRKRIARNARDADVIAVITPPLVDQMHSFGVGDGVQIIVLPNGAPTLDLPMRAREPIAGVVGQLNERLDLGLLEAVADAGVRLRLIGPRVDRDPAFGKRLDRLIGRDGVEWTGGLGPDELREQLATIGVGLTPYAESAFNRASFPLKTLEYLAAGIAVVSSDLAASRWLDTAHVTVAASERDFAEAVVARIAELGEEDEDAAYERTEFARSHSWPIRAHEFLALLEPSASLGRAAEPRRYGHASATFRGRPR